MIFDTMPKREKDTSVFALRRRELIDAVKTDHPNAQGIIMLVAAFEDDKTVFRQESSFYYFTGIQEPGAVALIDLEGTATLLLPQFSQNRDHWVHSHHPMTKEHLAHFGFADVAHLGDPCSGYQMHPYFARHEYGLLLERLEKVLVPNASLFMLHPGNAHAYFEQRFVIERLISFMPQLANHVRDISAQVAQLRRSKDMSEIETMYKAIEVTMLAHSAAAQAIADGVAENYVQASLEAVYTFSGARIAFPSIVGSGKNSTTLHYNVNNSTMHEGDLVVVDIGAEVDYYCADLTRTYPVSGKFTKRQREIYTIVLETQEYIASIAKPGMWLSNKEHEDKSLNHLARKFLHEKGYAQYFPHGIGHFLGIDVHDVGDVTQPLQEGDVITIEPGIYIPEERLGVRIEDNYWIVQDGAVCMSEHLPKKPEDIEQFMIDVKS